MKNAGLFFAGVSITTGIGAAILLAANLMIWAILTAWIGSAAAFIGFGLIAYALQPGRLGASATDAAFVKGDETLAEVA